MRLGPFEIALHAKATVAPTVIPASEGWWPKVRESFAGAWQRNVEVRRELVLAQSALFSCLTLISGDIGKLRIKLMELDNDGIWKETASSAFGPVLRKPNNYQTRQQFIETWILSKLTSGNAYCYKVRDSRGVVVEMHILNPHRVTPLVGPMDGSVFYRLQQDHLAGITAEEAIAIPASELMHDRFNCLFHPLVGLSPIYACGLAATQALKIQENSARFFANQSRPSGVLTAPAQINEDTAKRLQDYWQSNFSGDNSGRVAVLGDGLKYSAMSMSAEEAQMVEQLKLASEQVCSTFHVPSFMIGGPAPNYNNVESLQIQYLNQCLQVLIEALESCLDEGLGLTKTNGRALRTEVDIDGLLRMDTSSQTKSAADLVGAGISSPNEARRKFGLPPVDGGEAPYLQMQNYSLAALARRGEAPSEGGSAESKGQMLRALEAIERAARGLQRRVGKDGQSLITNDLGLIAKAIE